MAALCLLCCVACTPQKDTPKKLKVLSWNVWHGGHSKTYPGKGCEGTVGILKKSGADVVLMVETYGAAPMVADSLGYQYYLISDNLCIYSRYPIVEKYAFPDSIGTFNFGGVKIDMDGWHSGAHLRHLAALFARYALGSHGQDGRRNSGLGNCRNEG